MNCLVAYAIQYQSINLKKNEPKMAIKERRIKKCPENGHLRKISLF
jgi:hypothetical protein